MLNSIGKTCPMIWADSLRCLVISIRRESTYQSLDSVRGKRIVPLLSVSMLTESMRGICVLGNAPGGI